LFIVDKFGTSWHAVTTGKEVLVKLPEYAKRQAEKIIQSLRKEEACAVDGAASD
jgi:hypothetical protein